MEKNIPNLKHTGLANVWRKVCAKRRVWGRVNGIFGEIEAVCVALSAI
jgi:hypothetical protein